MDLADPKSVQSAVAKGKAEEPGTLKYLRKNIPSFAKAELNGCPEYLYIRDDNRLETEYVLNDQRIKLIKMVWDN